MRLESTTNGNPLSQFLDPPLLLAMILYTADMCIGLVSKHLELSTVTGVRLDGYMYT